MKTKTILSAFLMCVVFFGAHAQTLTIGQAINKAGKQRMLSQRMAKDYLAIGSGVKVEEATKELDESASNFNENFNDLMLFAKTKDLKDALDNVNTLWQKFRLKVTETPSLEEADNVLAMAFEIVASCNVVVDKLQASSGNKAAILPNLCGKQRMLSQRMAALYIANNWKVPSATIAKDMAESISNFDIALSILLKAPENNDEINKILKVQETEWAFFKKSLTSSSENMMPGSIFSSSNLLLKNFDVLTGLYAKIIVN